MRFPLCRSTAGSTLLFLAALPAAAQAQTSAALADSLLAQAVAHDDLAWSARHPVTWQDFRGRPHRRGSTAAETSSGVSYTLQCRNTHLSFAVLATFSPSESWVRPDIPSSPTASARTLRHERTHFNITELFARRLRQAMAASRDICPYHTRDARRLFERLRGDSDDTQARYDRETGHGTVPKAQARWDRTVAAGLDSLRRYEVEVRR